MPPALVTVLVWAAGLGAAVWGVSEATEEAADATKSLSESIVALTVAVAGAVLVMFASWALFIGIVGSKRK